MEDQTVFDLNEGIREWRESLASNAAFRADDLEQLEGHLRDSVAALQAKGLSAPEAFWVARDRLGSAGELSGEFAKVNAGGVWTERILWMLIGYLWLGAVKMIASTVSLMGTAMFRLALKGNGLLGPLSLVLLVITFVGVLAVAWRSAKSPKGAVPRLVEWMRRHPVLTGLAVFSITVFDFLLVVLSVKALPEPVFITLVPWRSVTFDVVSLVVYPVALGWLLARAKMPKGALQS
jgi:hypothetical protein